MKIILLCGGSGTKLWPLSRRNKSKLFAPLIDGRSVFRINLEILLSRYPASDIFLSTTNAQVEEVKKESQEIPDCNYILEPEMRQTGPAYALAMARLFIENPDEVFTVVQADELRMPEEKFLDFLDNIVSVVEKEGQFLTGGIFPKFPIMGVDYVLLKDQIKDYKDVNIFSIEKFLGRTDDYDKTKKLISNPKVITHTTHYTWTPRKLINLYKEYTTDWYEAIEKMIMVFQKDKSDWEGIAETFSNMRRGKIAELTDPYYPQMIMAELPCEYYDIGTWASVVNFLQENGKRKDREMTVFQESKNVYVNAPKGKIVSIIGLDDIAVIDTEDGLLVTALDKAGKVGEVVQKIEENGWEEYL